MDSSFIYFLPAIAGAGLIALGAMGWFIYRHFAPGPEPVRTARPAAPAQAEQTPDDGAESALAGPETAAPEVVEAETEPAPVAAAEALAAEQPAEPAVVSRLELPAEFAPPAESPPAKVAPPPRVLSKAEKVAATLEAAAAVREARIEAGHRAYESAVRSSSRPSGAERIAARQAGQVAAAREAALRARLEREARITSKDPEAFSVEMAERRAEIQRRAAAEAAAEGVVIRA